jgi:hypothetical protein
MKNSISRFNIKPGILIPNKKEVNSLSLDDFNNNINNYINKINKLQQDNNLYDLKLSNDWKNYDFLNSSNRDILRQKNIYVQDINYNTLFLLNENISKLEKSNEMNSINIEKYHETLNKIEINISNAGFSGNNLDNLLFYREQSGLESCTSWVNAYRKQKLESMRRTLPILKNSQMSSISKSDEVYSNLTNKILPDIKKINEEYDKLLDNVQKQFIEEFNRLGALTRARINEINKIGNIETFKYLSIDLLIAYDKSMKILFKTLLDIDNPLTQGLKQKKLLY